jgi:hypothetical protein
MKQKLIDQLLHKAGARFGAEGIDYSDFTSSKFAELIVRECVAICRDVDGEDNIDAKSGRQDCAVEIKEHFGVEA